MLHYLLGLSESSSQSDSSSQESLPIQMESYVLQNNDSTQLEILRVLQELRTDL